MFEQENISSYEAECRERNVRGEAKKNALGKHTWLWPACLWAVVQLACHADNECVRFRRQLKPVSIFDQLDFYFHFKHFTVPRCSSVRAHKSNVFSALTPSGEKSQTILGKHCRSSLRSFHSKP